MEYIVFIIGGIFYWVGVRKAFDKSQIILKSIFLILFLVYILIGIFIINIDKEIDTHHMNVTEQGVNTTSSLHHEETRRIIIEGINTAMEPVLDLMEKIIIPHATSSKDIKQD